MPSAQGISGSTYRHLWLFRTWEGGRSDWHLVRRGQRCWEASHKAQEGPTAELPTPQINSLRVRNSERRSNSKVSWPLSPASPCVQHRSIPPHGVVPTNIHTLPPDDSELVINKNNTPRVRCGPWGPPAMLCSASQAMQGKVGSASFENRLP